MAWVFEKGGLYFQWGGDKQRGGIRVRVRLGFKSKVNQGGGI